MTLIEERPAPADAVATAPAPAPAEFATGWHAIVDHLAAAGVRTLFGLPADDLTLLTALDGSPLRLVTCRDQRNAAFLATGHAIQSGTVSVCVVGKGPAVTNTLTGLLEARASAAPVIVLAAGTARDRVGTGAFQELDQVAVARPLTKWAVRVDDPARLLPVLERALLVAAAGAPGPVYVEVPDQLLTTTVPKRTGEVPAVTAVPRPGPDPASVDASWRTIAAARRPIVLVGGGMRHGNADHMIEHFADAIGAAVFSTASGRGAVDEDAPTFLGLAGLYSPAEAAPLWADTDLVIALGSRIEETATMQPGFAPAGTTVVQVNVDEFEFVAEHPGPKVMGDGRLTVQAWSARAEAVPGAGPTADPAWVARVRDSRAATAARAAGELAAATGELTVIEVLAAIDRIAPADRVLVQENGLADMWPYFYPHWNGHRDSGSVVPSEQTSLGFGAAAAGGVALAAPGRPVIAFVGDGAFAMVRNDVETLVSEGIPVLFVVLGNGGYGWLQSQQEQLTTPHVDVTFARGAERMPVAVPGVHVATLDDRTTLDDELRTALAACAAGRVAVLDMPVGLRDAALADVALDVVSAH